VKKTINSKEIIEEYENLGKRIADLRYKNGCSQQNLSKALNIPQSSYSNYETGNRKMPITLIKRIAEHFNVTVDYLLDMNCSKSSAISIALHQDTDRWTNEELEYLNVVKDFILEKRKQKGDRN
jgi:transcriptional regulator with XRE-family HTH domain